MQFGYKNLFPVWQIMNDKKWALQSDGSFVFVGTTISSAYPETSPIGFSGAEGQRYTISFDFYTEQNVGSTGNGVYICFLFSDGTNQTTALNNEKSTYYHITNTSTANKKIVGIFFRTGTSGGNIYHIKNIMLAEGIIEQDFVPYYFPIDIYARKSIEEKGEHIKNILRASENLVNQDFFLNYQGWTKNNDDDQVVYSGESTNIKQMVIFNDFDTDTIYTTSFEAYTDQETVTTGNGFRIYYDYTDGTTLSKYVENTATDWTEISLTNKFGKNISALKIALASGAAGNTWHVRKFQVRKGNRVKNFVPYESANDTVLRSDVNDVKFHKLPWWNNGRIKMAMHQGMRSASQQIGNCELSFVTAGQHKAWAIETDIRVTSDGKWVCFHDIALDSLTDGSGNVKDNTLAYIRSLHYRTESGGSIISDQIIPTFEEYLQICKVYNCVPLIEWKIRPTLEQVEEVVGILADYGFYDCDYMFLANIINSSAVIRSVTNAPVMQVVSNINDVNSVITYTSAAGVNNWGIDFDRYLVDSINHDLIASIHDAGMFCGVWSVNNEDSVIDFYKMGIDIVTSDYIADL